MSREITSMTILHDKERNIVQVIINRVPKRGCGSSLNLGYMDREKWIKWIEEEISYSKRDNQTLMEQFGLGRKNED